MASVLDLMILWLEVDSVEDLPNFGSAEADPAIGRVRLMRPMAVPRQYTQDAQSVTRYRNPLPVGP